MQRTTKAQSDRVSKPMPYKERRTRKGARIEELLGGFGLAAM